MTDLEGFLEIVRLLAFLGALVAAVLVWRKQHRGRSSTYVVGAFASILLVFVVALIPEGTPLAEVAGRSNPVFIMGLPALLLAFAWSFDSRLPGWVRGTIGAAMVVAVVLVVVPPGPAEERSTVGIVLVIVYLGVWTTLAVLAAARLWSAAGDSRPVVLRLRLMSVGVLVFNGALFAAVFPTPEALQIWTGTVLPIASGGLFLLAFVAPPPLRRMWRSESTELFVEVQRALIAAETLDDVYERLPPLLSRLLGADVAIAADGDTVCATHGIAEDDAQRLLSAAGDQPDRRSYVSTVGRRALLVRPTRYAPPLDDEGRQLADGLALHLALALDRAELLETHKAAREETQRSREELETTVVGLAHDLRNPTTALAGFAHLLATSDDPAQRAEMAEHLEASAAYIEGLVSALLEVSRIGRTQTEVEPVDLTAVARRVVERWRATHPDARFEIGALGTFEVNPGRAEQLLDNLVGNALRHGDRDDITITLEADRRDDEVALRVADDGVGIAPDDREDVFRLFHRSQGQNATNGSGVGLTLVRRIAESYGGTVELEDVERGVSIAIRLPTSLVTADLQADRQGASTP